MGSTVDFIKIYSSMCRLLALSRTAAAMAYYLTMTFFPLLAVIYSVLNRSYDTLVYLSRFAENLLSDKIINFTLEFVSYVEEDAGALILPLGLLLLLSYASAALRVLHGGISRMQGGEEYRGIRAYFMSYVYSLMFLAVLYYALLVLISGRGLVENVAEVVPGMSFLFEWLYMRYVILATVLFLLLVLLYYVPKRNEDRYSVLPGAFFSCVAIVLISPLFSVVMGSSLKYSMVYGSLASLILLMLWIYMCCFLVCSGAVFNLALYGMKNTDAHKA